MKSFRMEIGREVEVHANGSTYRGTLFGISETDVYLKTSSRTWTIPLDRVQSMRYADPTKSFKLPSIQSGSSNTKS